MPLPNEQVIILFQIEKISIMENCRCPHCDSRCFEIVGMDTCLCLDCGHQFIVNECVFSNNNTSDDHNIQVPDKEQANSMSYEKGEYKICPNCRMKIPVAAKQCPFCKYMTWGEAAKQTLNGVVHIALYGAIIILILILIFGGI